MSALVAVVPVEIRRKWDRLATAQLIEAANRLAVENDDLIETVSRAQSAADNAWDAYYESQLQLCEANGTQPGLTMDGRIVEVAVLPNPGATIDDDDEYRLGFRL